MAKVNIAYLQQANSVSIKYLIERLGHEVILDHLQTMRTKYSQLCCWKCFQHWNLHLLFRPGKEFNTSITQHRARKRMRANLSTYFKP